MHRQDRAYVLATQPLGESDVLVTLFCEHAGIVRGVAPAARRSRRRFGGALEPLTLVQASWVERAGRELHRIDALDLLRSHAPMQADPALQAACAVLVDVLRATGREGHADPTEFRLVGAVLEALEGRLDPWVAVRYFEHWTLRLHGVLPDLASCASCGDAEPAWAVAGAGLLCDACLRRGSSPGRRMGPEHHAFLRDAALRPPSEMGEHAGASRPGGPLELLLRGALEAFAERTLRSYRHLGLAMVAEPARPWGGGAT